MSIYLDTLNETYVTYVRDLGEWGWNALAGLAGFEAVSPCGEIRAFLTYRQANTWRIREVKREAAFREAALLRGSRLGEAGRFHQDRVFA